MVNEGNDELPSRLEGARSHWCLPMNVDKCSGFGLAELSFFSTPTWQDEQLLLKETRMLILACMPGFKQIEHCCRGGGDLLIWLLAVRHYIYSQTTK